jgi:hypothetical protein
MIPLLARLLDEGAQRSFLRTKGSWVPHTPRISYTQHYQWSRVRRSEKKQVLD